MTLGAVAVVRFHFTSRREEHQEDVRLRVMRLINKNPEMSLRQITDRVGITNGSAYYIMIALVDKGLVKLENFKYNSCKGQYAYLMTPKGIQEKSLLAHRFIKRKRQEFGALKAEIVALEEETGLVEKVTPSLQGKDLK